MPHSDELMVVKVRPQPGLDAGRNVDLGPTLFHLQDTGSQGFLHGKVEVHGTPQNVGLLEDAGELEEDPEGGVWCESCVTAAKTRRVSTAGSAPEAG